MQNYSIDIIPVGILLNFSFLIFVIGILGIVFNRANLIILMLYVELTLFGASFNFIIFSKVSGDPTGQIAALFILAVAAADAAVGLGLLMNTFQLTRSVSLNTLSRSKG
jgi:NADH:ubiquinone oxidoreductase subunit K